MLGGVENRAPRPSYESLTFDGEEGTRSTYVKSEVDDDILLLLAAMPAVPTLEAYDRRLASRSLGNVSDAFLVHFAVGSARPSPDSVPPNFGKQQDNFTSAPSSIFHIISARIAGQYTESMFLIIAIGFFCTLPTQICPAEFIGFIESQHPLHVEGEPICSHDELMANFFAQVGDKSTHLELRLSQVIHCNGEANNCLLPCFMLLKIVALKICGV